MSFWVIGSSKRRPIRRLIAKKVYSGLVTAWRFAGWPMSRSPSPENDTMEGVVRPPSEFSITLGVEPSITATQELVVPRSMPITLAIYVLLAADGMLGPFGKQPRPIPDAKAESKVVVGYIGRGITPRKPRLEPVA